MTALDDLDALTARPRRGRTLRVFFYRGRWRWSCWTGTRGARPCMVGTGSRQTAEGVTDDAQGAADNARDHWMNMHGRCPHCHREPRIPSPEGRLPGCCMCDCGRRVIGPVPDGYLPPEHRTRKG